MKRFKVFAVAATVLFLTACSTLQQVASVLVPSQYEMAGGLKDALSQGVFRGIDAFADPNGNPLVRFALPGDAAKIENALQQWGLDKTFKQVTQKYTNAMATAVVAAKPIFLNSIKNMSIKDAAGILITDNTHATTDYFKNTTTSNLMTAFRTIVDSTVKLQGADKDWKKITSVYNAIPFISKPLEDNLTDFVAARAIDAMFVSIANEEKNIRTNLSFRKTDMMKKVFAYADDQMKKKNVQYNLSK